MTAVSVKSGATSARRSSVVLPLPRNPVSTVAGKGASSGVKVRTRRWFHDYACDSKARPNAPELYNRLRSRGTLSIMAAITRTHVASRREGSDAYGDRGGNRIGN